jgi:hypothetical protein
MINLLIILNMINPFDQSGHYSPYDRSARWAY